MFTLSARDENALSELVDALCRFLEQNPALRLADICYTANTGRALFARRLALTAGSKDELRDRLQSKVVSTDAAGSAGGLKVAFLFTGQGAQYEGMGRQLYESEPVFRAALERCAAILAGELERPLLEVIYPEDEDVPAVGLLDQTNYTQPALFALEYALAELWQSWGIEPDVVMGHSVGEYVAACVAGVMSLEDGLTSYCCARAFDGRTACRWGDGRALYFRRTGQNGRCALRR